LALKGAVFGAVTQNNGHYAVKFHSKSPLSILLESPQAYALFLCVNKCKQNLTNLHPISNRFSFIAMAWRAPVCAHVSKRKADTSNTDVSV